MKREGKKFGDIADIFREVVQPIPAVSYLRVRSVREREERERERERIELGSHDINRRVIVPP